MSSTARSLILGAYSRLPVSTLEPFARSLRASGYRGRLCIVVGDCSDEQRVDVDRLADVVIDVRSDFCDCQHARRALLGYLKRQRGLRRAYDPVFRAATRLGCERDSQRRWACLEYHLEGLQALRYMYYYRYLVEQAADADYVMLSDLRDVVFQRDPFEQPVSGLELYLEDESVRIGDGNFNTLWLRQLFGSDAVAQMHAHRVSCSGTVVASREAMLDYCAGMMLEILWRRRPIGPRDQGVHNRLIYEGRFPRAAIVENDRGRVLTLGQMACPRVATDGTLRRSDGSVPAVVHQWDRHPKLAEEWLPRMLG